MKILIDEFRQILRLLVKNEVDFILIGGYAVIYYGFPRSTGDLDVWVSPDDGNKKKVLSALREFGIQEEDIEIISGFNFYEPQCFHIGKQPKRIDFLTKITGISYQDARSQVMMVPIEDLEVSFIGYHHLILSKISNNRPKDKMDVEELQRINLRRKNPY